ncbi:MAG: hypothetical protein QM479_04660 [Pseudomonadota bacterium]
MKKYICLYIFLFYSLLSSASHAEIATPRLTISAQCQEVEASWDSIEGATGYQLWYKSFNKNSFWEQINFDSSVNTFSASLPDDAKYYVSILAMNGQQRSQFASTKIVRSGNFLLPPNQKLTINNSTASINWNRIEDAKAYQLWYSLDSMNSWQQLELDNTTHSISADLNDRANIITTMRSIDSSGHASRFSNTISIVIGEQPQLLSDYKNTLYPEDFSDVFPASNNSQYASVLKECVYSKSSTQSCKLSKLPLLGQQFFDPDIDDIMARTLVSHPWMAERFKQFLQLLPTSSLKLFRAVTAIVISGDIRPAHYKASTGAIYIDPSYLFINTDSTAIINTVDQTPDFRASCGNALKYTRLYRYLKDGNYAYHSQISDRTINDVLYLAARLFFHELSHANDYFPPALLAHLNLDISVHEAADVNIKNRISYQLEQQFPLSSDILKYQADVMFACTNATCEQTAYSAETIAEQFANDISNDIYSYSTVFEDLAMLSEEALMHYFLGVERDIAITNVPTSSSPTGNDFIVQWGQRNRLAEPKIINKLKFIMQQLIPEADFSNYLDNLAAPIAMIKDKSWNNNLFPDSKLRAKKPLNFTSQAAETTINYN